MLVYEDNTQSIILNRMIGNVSNDIDTSEGSLTHDALAPASSEFAQAYIALDQVVNKFDLSKLSGDELALRINQRTGLIRNAASFATGVLTVTGTGTININTIFQTSGAIQFAATETKTISGTGTINIQAVVAGASGIVPASQITIMPVIITGITAVTNPSQTIGGYDAESDTALLERYYEKIQIPATSGNKGQFKSWAKEVAGVGDAIVYPLWNGNTTVKVIIIDANKQPPAGALVTSVQNHIDPGITGTGDGVAPIGAFCTVAGATGKTIAVSFTATKDTNFTDGQRLANVTASITNYFKSVALSTTLVSYAQVGAAILQSAGILDYSSLTLNGGSANITLSQTSTLTEVPVLGVVTIV